MNASPGHIAIVDDEEAVRRALSRLLKSAGYEVEVFGGGDTFLASLPGRRPGCVVLDLHMPSTDGFAILEVLSREGSRVPVLVITGHDTPEARARAIRAGVSGYLRKPIDGQQLINCLEEAMARG